LDRVPVCPQSDHFAGLHINSNFKPKALHELVGGSFAEDISPIDPFVLENVREGGILSRKWGELRSDFIARFRIFPDIWARRR
jgi:hypothetical protein